MKVLMDSDALYGLFFSQDPHHSRARQILEQMVDGEAELWLTNLVRQEVATVISYRLGQVKAKKFLESLSQMDCQEVFVNEKLTEKTWRVFKKQKGRGVSFVDCANVAAYRELGMEKIFSFDKFYGKMGLGAAEVLGRD